MVRGLAALLAGTAWFLVVGDLPAVEGDAALYLGGCLGAVAIGLCALAPLAGRSEPVGVAVFGVGALLLAIALASRDVGAAAGPAEALFAASAGLLFGIAFGVPAAVIALPVLVAGIDAAAVLSGDGGSLTRGGDDVDLLTFDLPVWGGGSSAARLGLLDATFLALFAAWALRFDLRPRLAIGLMLAGLAGAVALSTGLDRTIPALPFLAAGFLVAGARRALHLARAQE